MQPEVQAFFHEPTNTVSYVLKDPQSNACAIIDPVLDFDPASGRTSTVSAQAIAAFVETNKLRAEWILETHAHADHVSAAPYLKERLGGRIGIGANITIVQKVFGKIFNAASLSKSVLQQAWQKLWQELGKLFAMPITIYPI
jgi:glyoxylase-like metal-dependent hydrolase (beta-lactamase superfamily II)